LIIFANTACREAARSALRRADNTFNIQGIFFETEARADWCGLFYYGKPTARFLAYLKEQENGNKMDHNI
jgi:hypothetical protein